MLAWGVLLLNDPEHRLKGMRDSSPCALCSIAYDHYAHSALVYDCDSRICALSFSRA